MKIKNPRSHNAHLRNSSNKNTFLQSFGYTITLTNRKKFSHLRTQCVLFVKNWNPLHPKMLCAKIGKYKPGGSRDFVNLFSPFRYYLLLQMGVALHLKKLQSLQPSILFSKLKMAEWFWRRKSVNVVNGFSLLRYYLPWKKTWPFILENLNPLYPRMLCANRYRTTDDQESSLELINKVS